MTKRIENDEVFGFSPVDLDGIDISEIEKNTFTTAQIRWLASVAQHETRKAAALLDRAVKAWDAIAEEEWGHTPDQKAEARARFLHRLGLR